jgi:hypothetical protein
MIRKLPKTVKNSYAVYVLIMVTGFPGLLGCSNQDHYVDFTEPELIRLISGDSVKSWVRVNMVKDGKEQNSDECLLRQKYIFNRIGNTGNVLDFEIHSDSAICNSPETIIESGSCNILNYKTGPGVNDSISYVAGIDTTKMAIISISSVNMSLRGKIKGSLIESDFVWSE